MSDEFVHLIPELKELIKAGRRYLEGKSSIHELNGYASSLRSVATLLHAQPEVLELAEQWNCMINRRWNEWGLAEDPITEEEFCDWLKQQMFEGL